jgi:hypothetical protein
MCTLDIFRCCSKSYIGSILQTEERVSCGVLDFRLTQLWFCVGMLDAQKPAIVALRMVGGQWWKDRKCAFPAHNIGQRIDIR